MMINSVSSTSGVYGAESANKVRTSADHNNVKNKWKTSNLDENSGNSDSQQATSEIIVVDGQRMLLISHGMFKMKINLGPINMETPACGKIGDDEAGEKSNEATAAKTVKGADNTTVHGGLKSGMAEAEKQYSQNAAVTGDMSTGMAFSAGI